jgi:putative transposase
VKLPKLGWQRMRQSQPVPGVLKNASVTTERGKWFVSLQVDVVSRAFSPGLSHAAL